MHWVLQLSEFLNNSFSTTLGSNYGTRIIFLKLPNLSNSNAGSITAASLTGSGSSWTQNCNFSGVLDQSFSVAVRHADPVSPSLSSRASTVTPRVPLSAGFSFPSTCRHWPIVEFSGISTTLFATKTGCLLLLAWSHCRTVVLICPKYDLVYLNSMFFLNEFTQPHSKKCWLHFQLSHCYVSNWCYSRFSDHKGHFPFSFFSQISNHTHCFQRSVWGDM